VPYQLLADAVLVTHFGVVAFVVGGLLAVFAGNWLRWRWVNILWFRLAHLTAVSFIAVQAWLGQYCPLTILESWLRLRAGSPSYEKSFIEYWVQRLIYYEAPVWVFATVYTVFAVLVLFAWWYFPPHRRHASGDA
jgi:MFS family permease